MTQKKAIIIGAGPAGLTAAYELIQRTDIEPVVFEISSEIGGISKTVNYKGNRIDIGGHRFFSKSDRVMDWWKMIMPVQGAHTNEAKTIDNTYHHKALPAELVSGGPDPEKKDLVMLIRRRLSRIFFSKKFFNYPISLSMNTFNNLGFISIVKVGLSYIKARLFPIQNEQTLEDFIINRFGRELYLAFFKDYTEKVWGVPCHKIGAEWGAQRIKGLSITKAIMHAIKKLFCMDQSIDQKKTETTLIEQFLYPKYGPGQMWETVAHKVVAKGGQIHMEHAVIGLKRSNGQSFSIKVRNEKTKEEFTVQGDYVFSSMPIKELVAGMGDAVPQEVQQVARGLIYRDFITVGLLLNSLKIKNKTKIPTPNNIVPDNWIYIQEQDVRLGRLQIFNNWSPYMVKDQNKVWVGLEYFCNEGDDLWRMPDDAFCTFAINELDKIDVIDKTEVLDSTIIRIKKAYPAYFGTYRQFDVIKDYMNTINNLCLIGRNGMHRYNNSDHSMLSAMIAVDNIVNKVTSKENIWAVNVEEEYHESK